MRESSILRLFRALGVIFLIVVLIAFWQVWLVLGLAFLIYVYAMDRGPKYPRIYYFLGLPFKSYSGNENDENR